MQNEQSLCNPCSYRDPFQCHIYHIYDTQLKPIIAKTTKKSIFKIMTKGAKNMHECISLESNFIAVSVHFTFKQYNRFAIIY